MNQTYCNANGPRHRLSLPVLLVCILACPAVGRTQDALIDQEPHDLLTLKTPQRTLKLVPLAISPRRPLTAQDHGAPLIVQLLTRPGQKYSIEWADIEQVRLYEELILDEAARFVEQRQFDEAHRCYDYLRQHAADFPGVRAARGECLLREARYWQSLGRFENALALLEELYAQDPRHAGLAEAMGVAVDRLASACFESGQDSAARSLLATLNEHYPNHPVARQRQAELIERANQSYQQAREHEAAGRHREAHDAVLQARAIWPELAEARQLQIQLQQTYPLVRVGVSQLGTGFVDELVPSWPSLRTRRLVDRLLCAPAEWKADGATHAAPLGQWAIDGDRITLTLTGSPTWLETGRAVSATDVARAVIGSLASGHGTSADQVAWAPWTEVGVSSSQQVWLNWPARPPWWEAWLRIPPAGWSVNGELPRCGRYALAAASATSGRFTLRDTAAGTQPGPMREVAEQLIPSARAALRAVRQGRVLVYDRLPPWQLGLAARQSDLRLVPYAAPTVHLIVLNPCRARTLDPLVRRVLARALDRQRALAQLVGNNPAAQGRVLSGPFPWGYAYDESVQPPPADARLAVALWKSTTSAANSSDASAPPLTLVHAASTVAERAAALVAEQWQLDGMGPPVLTRPATSAELADPETADWDAYLLEWHAMEPLVDALRLFGPSAICRTTDPELNRLVALLAQATTHGEAETVLHALHRAVHERLPVIGLWQFQEHALCHPSLTGIGQHPLSLYQHLDNWAINSGEQTK